MLPPPQKLPQIAAADEAHRMAEAADSSTFS